MTYERLGGDGDTRDRQCFTRRRGVVGSKERMTENEKRQSPVQRYRGAVSYRLSGMRNEE
jgi:hypothetical protein